MDAPKVGVAGRLAIVVPEREENAGHPRHDRGRLGFTSVIIDNYLTPG